MDHRDYDPLIAFALDSAAMFTGGLGPRAPRFHQRPNELSMKANEASFRENFMPPSQSCLASLRRLCAPRKIRVLAYSIVVDRGKKPGRQSGMLTYRDIVPRRRKVRLAVAGRHETGAN